MEEREEMGDGRAEEPSATGDNRQSASLLMADVGGTGSLRFNSIYCLEKCDPVVHE